MLSRLCSKFAVLFSSKYESNALLGMKNRNRIYILIFITSLIIINSCGTSPVEKSVNSNYRTVAGEAQGTTYAITFLDSTGNLFSKHMADSIFEVIDNSLSVWNENSTISKFNRSDSMLVSDTLFLSVLFRAREMEELTGGAFQPMIMPLVKAWGFGPEGVKQKREFDMDSLLKWVHTPIKISLADTGKAHGIPSFLIAKQKDQELDVNGIAKGYTVDLLADFLLEKGIENFMVEVGGEIAMRGVNKTGENWHIGIDKPVNPDEDRALLAIAEVSNRSMATSGSYRKFYEENGMRFSHTIDPQLGKPVNHNLLSATVLAPNCANADALATAFMVMGVEKTKEFLLQHPELQLDVYLIFADGEDLKTYVSPGLEKMLKKV